MLRFYFKLSAWIPQKQQILEVVKFIQQEEAKRVEGFYFKNDAKSALVGRLLMRYAICKLTELKWNSFHLTRTSKGKPVIDVGENQCDNLEILKHISFNISHQGDYVLAVVDNNLNVGIDVMKTTEKHGNVEKFFGLMKRNFTENEWSEIKSPYTDDGRMLMFYRHWCLKESFVKASGDGIGYSLQRLNFSIRTSNENFLTCKTSKDVDLDIDGVVENQWTFCEDLIDNNHCSATAINCKNYKEFTEFIPVNIDDILASSNSLRTCNGESFWENFNNKDEKQNCL